MKLFDTHCHFETQDSSAIIAMLKRAREAGVERILAVGGSEALNMNALLAARLSSGDDMPRVSVALGRDRDQLTVPRLPIAIADEEVPQLVAWGEIGLDYYYSPETRAAQLQLFGEQLEEARRRNLPVIIHTREAEEDTKAILREIPSRGVIHSFTGTPNGARRFLDLGFYISISGIVTFKSADNVRETALAIPDDRLLIETDSPFLAPVPMRGNSNEPAYVRHTCEFLARLKAMTPEALASLTFENAERMLK